MVVHRSARGAKALNSWKRAPFSCSDKTLFISVPTWTVKPYLKPENAPTAVFEGAGGTGVVELVGE